jgi:hypothetical protein
MRFEWRKVRMFCGVLVLVLASGVCDATQLKNETAEAFDRYVAGREAQMDRDDRSTQNFLWVSRFAEAEREKDNARMKNGEVMVWSVGGQETVDGISVPDGLIQDWVATEFIPGAGVAQIISLLQDYDHHRDYFKPLVQRSELRHRAGDEFQVYFRLKQTHIMTVVLDSDYDIHYYEPDAQRAYSRSHSTRIAEIEDAGKPQERSSPPGDDHGFLWRLYSYWWFYQADGGTYVQVEAITLTRSVPTGFGWIVKPLIRSVPGESLRFTLENTRNAVKQKMAASNGRD